MNIKNPLAGMTVSNIACTSFVSGNQLESVNVPGLTFTPITSTVGLYIASNPTVNGA
jgi:hypothetical protein